MATRWIWEMDPSNEDHVAQHAERSGISLERAAQEIAEQAALNAYLEERAEARAERFGR